MNWGRVYVGVLVLAVGTILLLGNADVVDAGDVFASWWPVPIILAGVVSLIANRGQWIAGLIITLVGVAFLLTTNDIVDLGDFIWPVALIIVGLVILFGRQRGASREVTGDSIQSFNIFSGSELASHSKQFTGGSITAVFGAAEVDLRDALPAADAAVDVFTAFGGVELRVPDGWQVTVSGMPLFGAFENKTAKESIPADAPKLIVNATALFGGVEIKH